MTVGADPSIAPRFDAAACATSGLPPAACSSVATKRPDGFRSRSSGTRALMRSKSSSASSRPASCAIAIRCSTALVDPPVVATDAIAFSSDCRVMMSRGRTPPRTRLITRSPAARATSAFFGSVAGTLPLPSAAMPRNSLAIAIVLAVNWPPQAPAPGHAVVFELCRARRRSSCRRACAPTASNTS